MKLVTYLHHNRPTPVLRGEAIVDLSPVTSDLLSLIDGGAAALARARAKGFDVPERVVTALLGYLRIIHRRFPHDYPAEARAVIEAGHVWIGPPPAPVCCSSCLSDWPR